MLCRRLDRHVAFGQISLILRRLCRSEHFRYVFFVSFLPIQICFETKETKRKRKIEKDMKEEQIQMRKFISLLLLPLVNNFFLEYKFEILE